MTAIAITLGGFTIPMRNLYKLVEVTKANEVTNVTLGGTRYTDFTNNLRSWKLSFAYLCEDDFDDLYGVYQAQYNTVTYPTLVVPYYGINTPVKMSIQEDKDIKFDGEMIVDYTVTLEEQYAFS